MRAHHGTVRPVIIVLRRAKEEQMRSDELTEVRAAVARVCSEEPQMRASLERAGDASPLDRLIAAVRDGAELSELLNELHAALQRCGDAVGVFGPRAGLRE